MAKQKKRDNSQAQMLRNMSSAPSRMITVDLALPPQLREDFAKALADLLAHLKPAPGNLTRFMPTDVAAQVCRNLITVTTELETAWNCIRLCNIPAAQRQSRVAAEAFALTVLLGIPRDELLKLSARLALVKALGKYPEETLSDLTSPRQRTQGKQLLVDRPQVMSPAVHRAYLRAAEDILGVPRDLVRNLQDYYREVQHPAAHASIQNATYQFEGLETDGRAGAYFSEERIPSLVDAAEQLTAFATWQVKILGLTAQRAERFDWSEWPTPG